MDKSPQIDRKIDCPREELKALCSGLTNEQVFIAQYMFGHTARRSWGKNWKETDKSVVESIDNLPETPFFVPQIWVEVILDIVKQAIKISDNRFVYRFVATCAIAEALGGEAISKVTKCWNRQWLFGGEEF